jgi:hypothetical protein
VVEFAGAASFAADTNFFDAGGTSIGAMRVVMAIARNWGGDIPLDAFVAAPTAADLARVVTTGGKARAFDPLVALRSSARRQQDLCHAEATGEVLARVTVVDHAIATR